MGASWGPLGAILGPSWGLLGPPGRLLGPSWRTSIKTEEELHLRSPPWEPQKSALGALLGRSWSALGCARGRLGALSTLSWDPLGPHWNRLGASVGHRKRTGDDAEIIALPQVFERRWPLRGLLGGATLWTLRATHSVAAYMAGAAVQKKLPPLGWATGCALGRLEQNCFLQRLRHRLRARQPTIKRHPFDCAIGCALGRRQ